ncbi:hypothetical protein [Arundinibacter roseus]|uniref:hypothetical protein n=1 Tax=Arundinibacter roseus TaxID=2070510 RepID=UPI0014053B42|nr:hypothetical protein [Arundinibacter roseus]
MARKRGEPAIPGLGKELLEAPVYTSYPTNTPNSTPPAEDPDLVRKEKKEEKKK